jgi:NodT family efflux transporter outer membrane factor (OMF) lipoprotein
MASGTLMTWRESLGRCRHSHHRLLFLFLCLQLGSCAHYKPSETKSGITLPESYTIYTESAPAPDRWWESFGSEELTGLVGEAIAGNRDLRVSFARLEQSRALAHLTGSKRAPDLSVKAGVSETRRSTGDNVIDESTRSLSLVSSWELDFWGKLSADQRAALLDAEASREDLYASTLTLSSEVALKWLETISVKKQLALYQQQLETNRTILDLMEQRYLKGLANAIDIYQQRQAVAEIEAGLPPLEAQLESLRNELAVLVGKAPGTGFEITTEEFPDLKPPPAAGLPADLLSKRPDIRAAGLRLKASENQVSAARADRLPDITLTGTAGYSSDSLGDLLDKWLASLAANLTWPLLNSGTTRAEVTRREKIVEERLASYEQIVLEALSEVQDAMVSELKQVDYIEALQRQLAITRDGFREAVSRYRKGLSDYLPVLSALTSSQRLERTLVQARLERFSQRVMLHRALGGGWMEEEFEKTSIPESQSSVQSSEKND